MGKIITFFSYKGGVGRSMALTNVAVLLARWGYRVLMVDWDLEAPGLESFFTEYLPAGRIARQEGILDLLQRGSDLTREVAEPLSWHERALPVRLPGLAGALDLILAGQTDDGGYFRRVRSLDIQALYEEGHGGELIEMLRDDWKKSYDFILIDSRPGITDLGGICTIHLPDVLVLLLTPTEQALRGALDVARKAAIARQKLPHERLRVPVIPVPSRFDTTAEYSISKEWLDRFASELSELFADWLPTSVSRRDLLEVMKLPYVSYFSFGEKLPVLEQGTIDPTGLGYAYENLAALLANDLNEVDLLMEDRSAFLRAAMASGTRGTSRIVLFHGRQDASTADALARHLQGIRGDRSLDLWSEERLAAGHGWYQELKTSLDESAVVVLLISPAFLASELMGDDGVVRLLRRQVEEGQLVVPVVLEPAAWRGIPWMGRLQCLPADGHPVAAGAPARLDAELASIAGEIADLLEAQTGERLQGQAAGRSRFDVFLSYDSRDASAALEVAKSLRQRGVRVWIDREQIVPGSRWLAALEEAIESSSAIAVLIGRNMGAWQSLETRSLLSSFLGHGKPVIPVLLPGAPDIEYVELPLFLRSVSFVDLREEPGPQGLDRLVWGITGARPN
jgi:cellulose biosynthesis protein BcsQ